MNPLEMLKKGISALNPVPKKVNVPPPMKKNPVTETVTKGTGYLGDTAKKVTKRNQALEEAAKD